MGRKGLNMDPNVVRKSLFRKREVDDVGSNRQDENNQSVQDPWPINVRSNTKRGYKKSPYLQQLSFDLSAENASTESQNEGQNN